MKTESPDSQYMKLYKFRSLGSDLDFERIKEILQTGGFWCSRFSELNDPMEGVYLSSEVTGTEQVYDEKKSYMICSFSMSKAFSNPAMWGYYAGGFKGVAIELQVLKTEVKKVDYLSEVPNFEDCTPDVLRILTTKLKSWSHEAEYRFLKQSQENSQRIGKIVSVFYAEPYRNTINHKSVYTDTKVLRLYDNRIREIKSIAGDMNIDCIPVGVINGNVVEIKANYRLEHISKSCAF